MKLYKDHTKELYKDHTKEPYSFLVTTLSSNNPLRCRKNLM